MKCFAVLRNGQLRFVAAATIAAGAATISAMRLQFPSETHPCSQRLSISEISILGYCTHSNIDDQENSNRGIVIYVKEELSLQVGNIYFKTDFNEQVWISIKLKKSDELIFGCLYRSPTPNTDNHSSLLLIEEATQRNSSHMVLVGDFNYPGIDWDNLTATRIEEKQFLESVCDNFSAST